MAWGTSPVSKRAAAIAVVLAAGASVWASLIVSEEAAQERAKLERHLERQDDKEAFQQAKAACHASNQLVLAPMRHWMEAFVRDEASEADDLELLTVSRRAVPALAPYDCSAIPKP